MLLRKNVASDTLTLDMSMETRHLDKNPLILVHPYLTFSKIGTNSELPLVKCGEVGRFSKIGLDGVTLFIYNHIMYISTFEVECRQCTDLL